MSDLPPPVQWTGWVLAVTYLDGDGVQCCTVETADGQPVWVTLGLVEWVAALERGTMERHVRRQRLVNPDE